MVVCKIHQHFPQSKFSSKRYLENSTSIFRKCLARKLHSTTYDFKIVFMVYLNGYGVVELVYFMFTTIICIMVHGRIKGYCQCYKLFVTQLTTGCDTVMQQLVWSQIKCEAIKEIQTSRCLLQQSIHPLAVFHTQASGFISVSHSDDTNFHQISLRRVKLHINLARWSIIAKPYRFDQP